MGPYDDSNSTRGLLQSKDHGELLNSIDLLRAQGISPHVPLPQIIVCGDQSSGKSAVLNAVSSGIQFPAKDNLCTRFATELILRRGLTESVTVSITPGADRTDEERVKLLSFQPQTVSIDEFPSLIEAAKEAMGLNSDAKAFANDVLRVEVMGPKQPNLTLVDLPGVIHARNRQQSAEDIELVSSLVRSYMANTRSIILAVVSAKNDLNNQIITSRAREVDPDGLRTLGIITKPDTLHRGSDSEKAFISLAKNEDIFFRLGWHVLRNRDYDSRDSSSEERDELEKEFFAQGPWAFLPTNILGIGTLRPRLSTVLKNQVLLELPNLTRDVTSGIEDCKRRLNQLGDSRGTPQEQKKYLMRASRTFSSLVKCAIDGTYANEFFGNAMTSVGYNRRLRAVLQNLLLEFARDMRDQGQALKIIETTPPKAKKGKQISRSDFIDNVQVLMERSRGCELPGTFNPLIVGDLFYQQSKPWKDLVDRYTKRVLEATRNCIESILRYVVDEVTSEGLLSNIIDPAMQRYSKEMDLKITEIMRPHQVGHPITYNHYFTENIQKARQEHAKREQGRRMNNFFGIKGDVVPSIHNTYNFSPRQLLDTLNTRTEADMDRYACSEALFCMEAYYKVAMKVIVDNVAALCIEHSLLATLSDIFSPDTVIDLSEELIRKIAAEPNDSSIERARATQKLKILETGLQTLSRIGRQKQSSRDRRYSSDEGERESVPDVSDTDDERHGDRDPTEAENFIEGEQTRGENGVISEFLDDFGQREVPVTMPAAPSPPVPMPAPPSPFSPFNVNLKSKKDNVRIRGKQ